MPPHAPVHVTAWLGVLSWAQCKHMEERFSSAQRAWFTEAGIEYEKLPEHILLELYPDILHYGSRKDVAMLMKTRLLESLNGDNQLIDALFTWYVTGREMGLHSLNLSWQLSVDAQYVADAVYGKANFSNEKLRLGLACITLAHIIVFSDYELDAGLEIMDRDFVGWLAHERPPRLAELWSELGLST